MINRDSEVSFDESNVPIQEPLLVQQVEAKKQLTQSPAPVEAVSQLGLSSQKMDKVEKQEVPQEKSTKERLMSLDVYRGLTVFGMILADQTLDIDGAVWWLIHPKWNGLTCADLVFPAFLFIMGMAIPLAVSKGRPIKSKNIIRVFALFGIGLALNIIEQFNFSECTVILTQ